MGTAAGNEDHVSLAEIACALAVAQDHCFGQPPGSQLRGTLVALDLCEALDLTGSERDTVYWATLLRFLGCTGHAHEVAVVFGDDVAARARSFEWDMASPVELARELVSRGGAQHKGLARARAVVALLAGGRPAAELNFRTGCEVADSLAQRLALPPDVRAALAHSFERWNGSGFPNRAKGGSIPIAARVSLVSHEFEVLARIHGVADASTIVRRRAGRSYDPDVVEVLVPMADAILSSLEKIDPWDRVLACAPEPATGLHGEQLDAALEVVADFADLKSPYTAGHSRGVAAIAAGAASHVGLPESDIVAVRRAGLIHDIGRCAVSNAVWDKPGPLTRDELDAVQLHPLRSEQLWRRMDGLRRLVPIVGHHHERASGGGYFRGSTASTLPLPDRILAAADCFHALTEQRPHRPAHSATAAAAIARELVAEGQLDGVATDAVLAAAGQRTSGRRSSAPGGLTSRETDVLSAAARGLSIKQIAAELAIAPKTVDHHLQSVYAKIGVSTRGAAALWAMQHGLVTGAG